MRTMAALTILAYVLAILALCVLGALAWELIETYVLHWA